MRASTRAGLVLALLASGGNAHADWIATGRFEYIDRTYGLAGFTGTLIRPVREADVQIFDVSSNAVLAQGATNATGDFSIPVPDSQTRTVGVRALASTTQTASLAFSVIDDFIGGNPVHSYHTAATDVPNHPPAADVNFGPMTMPAAIGLPPATDWSSQVFNIFDCCLLMADWIKSADGARPAVPLTVGFHPGQGRTGSFYSPGINRFSCSDDDGYDDPNILHELGHYVEDEFGFSTNTGGTHFIGDDDQDPRLSWSEGFGTFVSNASLDFAGRPRPDIYSDRDSFGASGGGGFAYELESPVTGGGANEQAVNAALYDLIDSAATSDASTGADDDPLLNRQASVWSVIEEFRARQPAATTVEEFWDLWFDLGHGEEVPMRTVFAAHSIDFFPDAQEPNGLLESATPLTVNAGYQENTFYRVGSTAGGDEDWFRFDAIAGQHCRIEINGAANSIFGRPDPEMFLIDAVSGQILAHSDDPHDASLNDQSSSTAQEMAETVPSILFRAPATRTYHVLVRHASYALNRTDRYGTYQIRVVDAGAPSPFISSVSAQRMRPGETYSVSIAGTDFATGAIVSASGSGISMQSLNWRHPTMVVARMAVEAGAQAGTRSITVTNPGAGSALSGPVLVVDPGAQPPVLISEIELGTDRVEVINAGTATATLTGWRITGQTGPGTPQTFTFPAFALGPGATVVVNENAGVDTATSLFDQTASFNWAWANGSTGDVTLIDNFGNAVDTVRFVSRLVTSHPGPPGLGALWMQPEILSPASGSLSRALGAASPNTADGLSPALLTMPSGATGRANRVDAFEPNDRPREAPLITRHMAVANLEISPRPSGSDVDWFGILLPAGQELEITAVFTHAAGNLDVDLYPPGEETSPLATANSATDNEVIHLTPSQTSAAGGGVYRIRVRGVGGATNSYALSIVAPAEVTGFFVN
ncbi:MAG: lamin tail domain-containing protein [Candidatus Sumerlaeia bacterium]|nr:lamin tail domain-containing protein [Candidatus Sumerlaeia bacterium]